MSKPLTPEEKLNNLVSKLARLEASANRFCDGLKSPIDYKKKVGIPFRHLQPAVRHEAWRCLAILLSRHAHKLNSLPPSKKKSYKGLLVAAATNMAKANLGLTMSLKERSRKSYRAKLVKSSIKTQLGLQEGLMKFQGDTLTDKWRNRRLHALSNTTNFNDNHGEELPKEVRYLDYE